MEHEYESMQTPVDESITDSLLPPHHTIKPADTQRESSQQLADTKNQMRMIAPSLAFFFCPFQM